MEKSETGGSDPCHPVAKHLAAEVCTGTLAPFPRVGTPFIRSVRLCGEPPKRSARRRVSGRRHSLRTSKAQSAALPALNGTCSNFRQTMVFFLLDRLRSLQVGPSRFELEKPLLNPRNPQQHKLPREAKDGGARGTQCVVFPPLVVGCSHL